LHVYELKIDQKQNLLTKPKCYLREKVLENRTNKRRRQRRCGRRWRAATCFVRAASWRPACPSLDSAAVQSPPSLSPSRLFERRVSILLIRFRIAKRTPANFNQHRGGGVVSDRRRGRAAFTLQRLSRQPR